jgi:hypothetical protein
MTDVQPGALPAPPATPAEASSRLTALKADPAWRDQFLAGNGPQVKEYHSLSEMAAKGGDVDRAMAGVADVGTYQSTEHREMIFATKMLRELGVDDAVIRQHLTGHEVSQQEFDAVTRLKADKLGDSEWVTKYMAGERAQQREMALMNIVLSSTIKKEAAA